MEIRYWILDSGGYWAYELLEALKEAEACRKWMMADSDSVEEYLALTKGEEGWIGIRRGEDTKANLAHMFWCVKRGTGYPPSGGDLDDEDKKEKK